MATIPEPDWLSLDETAILVRECTGAERSRIEATLTRAFRNGNITTRGRCHFYFGHYMQLELDGYCWDRADVNWRTSQFKQGASVFLDVEICRKDVLVWMGYEEDLPDAINGVREIPKEREDGLETSIRLDALEAWKKLGAATRTKYRGWYEDARSIPSRGNKTRIADTMILVYRESMEHSQVPKVATIRRTLNKFFVDWAD